MLEVRVLGPIEVRVDGEDLEITSPTQQRILAALACQPGMPVSRDKLIHLLWGDSPPRTANASLKSHISRLRSIIGEVIDAHGGGYVLNVGADQVDAHRFQHAATCETVEQADAALALWRGEPFAGFEDHDPLAAEARRLRELHLQLRRRRARLLLSEGRHGDAITEATQLTAERPLGEPAWVLLLEALEGAGRHADAVQAARRYRDHLDVVGLDPTEAFIHAESRVFTGVAPTDTDAVPASPATSHLPAVMVDVVGREREVEQVHEELTAHRLVTLVGAGGVGKTTLALVLGKRVAETRQEAWFATLADVEDPGSVAAAVARAVGAPLRDPLTDTLVTYLSSRSGLLILDNAEHLHRTVAEVLTRLLPLAPSVDVLVTSRRPLGIAGEVLVDVDPLDPPSALELFAGEAERVGRPLDGDQLQSAQALCERLDRLPLALRMAATRLRGLSLPELVGRLRQRLDLRGPAAADAGRHDTLDAVVRWSFDLLDPPGQQLLAQLSVFPGTFDVDAASAVADIDEDVALVLADLVDWSLVQATTLGQHARYGLLETVRTFASARLAEAPDADAVRLRFVELHLKRVEAIGDQLGGPDDVGAAEAFDEQAANFEAAHREALATGDLDSAARLAAAPYPLVYHRLRADIGAWADRTLEVLPDAHPRRPAIAAVVAVGRLNRGDPDGAQQVLRDLPDAPISRHGHEVLADINLYRGELRTAISHFGEAERLAAETPDPFTEAFAAVSRAIAMGYAGQRDAALRGIGDVRDRAEGLDSGLLAAWADYAEAELIAEEDPTAAMAPLLRSIQAADRAGWALLSGVGRVTESSLQARTTDPHAALPAFLRLVDHWESMGDRTHQWTTLRNLAVLLSRLDAHEAVAELVGASRAASIPTYGPEQDRLRDAAERAAAALGRDRFEELTEEGRAMDSGTTVDLALATVRGLLGTYASS